MEDDATSSKEYSVLHRTLFVEEEALLKERLLTMQREVAARIQEILSETKLQEHDTDPYWMSTPLTVFFRERIDRAQEALGETAIRSVEGTLDSELLRIAREFSQHNAELDRYRLLTILRCIDQHTEEVTLTPLELSRLTLELDGNQHETRYWTPAELFSKRMLVPQGDQMTYWHRKQISLRVCPVERYLQKPVLLQRTGSNSERGAALYSVKVSYGSESYTPHYPLKFSVPQEQEDLWLALFCEELQQLVREPLSPYCPDALAQPRSGTMKFPLVTVEEKGKKSEFNVTWHGAGVRTFNTRPLTAAQRRAQHFTAQEVQTELREAPANLQESIPESLQQLDQI